MKRRHQSLPAPENESDPTSRRIYATSLPGLAAALRDAGRNPVTLPADAVFQTKRLVPMYRIPNRSPQQEIENSVQVIDHVLERMRRLSTAYGEWRQFDAGAYFDLTYEQVDHLVKVTERVNTVHVIFFTDLLLPSFREAGRLWQNRFMPAYVRLRHMIDKGQNGMEKSEGVYSAVQPEMIQAWRRIHTIMRDTRSKLATDMGYLAANGAQEERYRWRHYWQDRPGQGVDRQLLPAWDSIPTLTLALEFPLPIHRQPGRLRRLRRNRDRRSSLHR